MKQEIGRMLEAVRQWDAGSAGNEAGAGGPLAHARGSDLGTATQELRAVLEAEAARPEVNAGLVMAALTEWLSATQVSGETIPQRRDRSGCQAPGEEQKGDRSGGLSYVREQVNELRQQIGEAERRQRTAENRLRVNGRLAASRLPKPLADLVASRFFESNQPNDGVKRDGNPVFAAEAIEIQEEDVDMEIQRVREAYAALSPVGRVMETGRVKVVREPEEKMQMALDRVFGLPVEDTGVPAFHGIREAYVAYTGDGEVTGAVSPHLRVREDYTTAGFPNALGNTLRRLLLRDYREQDYGIGLIAQLSSVPDFRTQERVRVGYFSDLPTVDTEAADYGELTAPTDEKASYSVVTFGGLVTVTRKAIINDDLGIVPQIVSRLGRSARRTLAQRVFNLMINNGTIYDGLAWFHATHGNLGSTALSAAELSVVRTAMRNSKDRPQKRVADLAGDGATYEWSVAGIAGWAEGFSRVVEIEYPQGERSPIYLEGGEWLLYAAPSGRFLRLAFAPSAGKTARVRFTAPHAADASTVPDPDFYAVGALAASLAARRLAAIHAQTGDSSIAADTVNYRSKAQEYMALARHLEQEYENLLGTDPERSSPASSRTEAWKGSTAGGERLTH